MSPSLLRRLLLPVSSDRESTAVVDFASALETLGIPPDEVEIWLSTELERWNSTGQPSTEFQECVEVALHSGADEQEWSISNYYFGLHEKLTSPAYGISWGEARELLSHVRLIADLALNHRMTAARIARVLVLEEEQAPRFSRALDLVLTALGSPRDLDLQEVEELIGNDRLQSLSAFADASLEEAASRIDSLAELVGVQRRLGPLMNALANDTATPFGPYLQILHFLLLSTEFYDHFLREGYEFSPRGVVAEFVFGGHPVALKSGNPFLNNAKKVRVLNEVWAEGADGNLEAARALAALLEVLDSLAYPARRELAASIRAWLVKVFDKFADASIDLPTVFSTGDLLSLLGHVSIDQSHTGGILEQRIVDMCSMALHPQPRWIHAGVGDSVNSTNASGRKFGDVEALDSQSASVVAYESHAGSMGSRYVAEHMRTLKRTLSERETDLLSRAAPDVWDIRVVFVAHSFGGDGPSDFVFDGGWRVKTQFIKFNELHERVLETPGLAALTHLFSSHCIPVLRSPRTPNRVRDSLLKILSGN